MKEMTIEEKAKRYDEAIKVASDIKAGTATYIADGTPVIDAIFPELKESEDERIRKEMITYLSTVEDKELIPYESWITWLEKQGEQKTVDKIAKEVSKDKTSAVAFLKGTGIMNEKGELADEYKIEQDEQKSIDDLTQQEAMDIAVAKCFEQGEQKSDDKVEPKFKAGDWVVCKNGSHPIFQVIERSWPNAKYRDIKGTEIFLNVFTLDKQYRPWTIQDAKAGDVLACENDIVIFKENSYNPKDKSGCMFVYCSCNNFYEIGGINPTDYKPATKEQRNLLFQKMKEAGYEWSDKDKKLIRAHI